MTFFFVFFFFLFLHKYSFHVVLVQQLVRLYEVIIHEVLRVDYLHTGRQTVV